MLMLWSCAQLYTAVLTLRRAQTLYALYVELISFTQLYVELIFFTQLYGGEAYAALRGANIDCAALCSFPQFTQLYEFYAALRS